MEPMNKNLNTDKQRHGCLIAWLIIMIVANSITSFTYLINGEQLLKNSPYHISSYHITLLALLAMANVIFAIMLFRWKKIGFYGFAATSIIAFGINLSIGLGIVPSLLGFTGIIILYAVLQIKKNGRSAWGLLE